MVTTQAEAREFPKKRGAWGVYTPHAPLFFGYFLLWLSSYLL